MGQEIISTLEFQHILAGVHFHGLTRLRKTFATHHSIEISTNRDQIWKEDLKPDNLR